MNRNERNLSYFGEAWDEQLDFDILLSLFWAIAEDSHQAHFNVRLISFQVIFKNLTGDKIFTYKSCISTDFFALIRNWIIEYDLLVDIEFISFTIYRG